jgi:hypothetical protein
LATYMREASRRLAAQAPDALVRVADYPDPATVEISPMQGSPNA